MKRHASIKKKKEERNLEIKYRIQTIIIRSMPAMKNNNTGNKIVISCFPAFLHRANELLFSFTVFERKKMLFQYTEEL